MYDDIVIGAGSAGAVIAARLSEDPERQVLLIEAGPDYSRIEDLPDDLVKPWISWVDHDWGFRGTARQGRDFPMYRGKVMGGTSAINGAIALRGVPADFDAWVELGCDQWSYEDVLPWYRKLESDPEGGDFHGTNGPVPIERSPKAAWQPTHRAFYDACREQGFDDVWDHNRPEATGVGPWPRNKRDGLRISTNIAYLMNIRDRKNLTIRHGVMVDRVRLEHGRATGVVLADGSVVEARRVCISAGAIVTPAILLRSGIGPARNSHRTASSNSTRFRASARTSPTTSRSASGQMRNPASPTTPTSSSRSACATPCPAATCSTTCRSVSGRPGTGSTCEDSKTRPAQCRTSIVSRCWSGRTREVPSGCAPLIPPSSPRSK